jgi:hypothetical protein
MEITEAMREIQRLEQKLRRAEEIAANLRTANDQIRRDRSHAEQVGLAFLELLEIAKEKT